LKIKTQFWKNHLSILIPGFSLHSPLHKCVIRLWRRRSTSKKRSLALW